MPDVHALLSASSSKRWLHCTPSVRLEEGFPNESSVYAAEGTFAHEVCEYKVRKYLHERVKRPQSEEFYTEEIDQITDIYYEFVVGVIEGMKRNGCEPLVLIETRVDYSHIAPSGFGTADMLIIGGTSLTVYPAASYINYFSGKYLVIINRDPLNGDVYIYMSKKCDKVKMVHYENHAYYLHEKTFEQGYRFVKVEIEEGTAVYKIDWRDLVAVLEAPVVKTLRLR